MTDKSIIDPKYRVKKEPDWLANLLTAHATKFKDVSVTRPNPENPEEKITTTEPRADGIDVDALFALSIANGANAKVEKFHAQRDSHGFAGRFRMTVRNILQAIAKQRHGLNVNGEFIDAPTDWLVAVKAPEAPTHKADGTKIAPPAKETEAASE
jgi:hypothetical protein